MKTLRNINDRKEILERLSRVRIDSARKWGKMSAHQMVCHLCDSFRGPMGQKEMSPMPGMIGRGVVKWIALYAPLPWAHGFKTRPEMDQEIGGTRPTDFATDVQELRRLLEQFTGEPREFAWRPHPIFMEMTDGEWMRWGYLHMDHHFRQFGA